MKTQLLYVELKSGYSDNGPAWIGKGFFSKTGQTIYFNGKILKRGKGVSSNHFDLMNGDEYWISGIKKTGNDRHWSGSGVIQIDENVISEYLSLTKQLTLTKNKFKIVKLDNIPAKQIANNLENRNI